MAAGYGIAGHTNTYTRASLGNWVEDKLADEGTRRRGFALTRFEAKTEASQRFGHPARERARDLGPEPLPAVDADPRAGQPPHILMAHGRSAHDPRADDPARFASVAHTLHAAAVAATPLTSTDALAEPDRRRPGVENALISGNRTGLMAARDKQVSTKHAASRPGAWPRRAGRRGLHRLPAPTFRLPRHRRLPPPLPPQLMVGSDPRDPKGAGSGRQARPTPDAAGTDGFTTTARLATRATESSLRSTAARQAGSAAAADEGAGVETVTVPDGLGGTVTRTVGRPVRRKPGFTSTFASTNVTAVRR